jgi:hypothetical protein
MDPAEVYRRNMGKLDLHFFTPATAGVSVRYYTGITQTCQRLFSHSTGLIEVFVNHHLAWLYPSDPDVPKMKGHIFWW